MASKMKFNKDIVLRLVILAIALFVFVVFALWARSAFLDYAMQNLRDKHVPIEQEEEQVSEEQENENEDEDGDEGGALE